MEDLLNDITDYFKCEIFSNNAVPHPKTRIYDSILPQVMA